MRGRVRADIEKTLNWYVISYITIQHHRWTSCAGSMLVEASTKAVFSKCVHILIVLVTFGEWDLRCNAGLQQENCPDEVTNHCRRPQYMYIICSACCEWCEQWDTWASTDRNECENCRVRKVWSIVNDTTQECLFWLLNRWNVTRVLPAAPALRQNWVPYCISS